MHGIGDTLVVGPFNIERLMLKLRRWWLLSILPFAAWGGCSMLRFDHSAELAQAVLYQPNSQLDENAFGAALSAKYPDGSAVEDLAHFLTGVGGTCFEGPAQMTAYCGGAPETRPPQCATQVNDSLHCDVPVAGTVCASYRLGVQAHISSDRRISNVVTHGSAVTC